MGGIVRMNRKRVNLSFFASLRVAIHFEVTFLRPCVLMHNVLVIRYLGRENQ